MLVLAAPRHDGTAARVPLEGDWIDVLTGAERQGGVEAKIFDTLPVAVLLRTS
jgi:hypothetical protein